MTSSQILLVILLGLTAALGNVLGGFFVVRREWSQLYLRYFVALGAGFMLGIVFLDIIPESLKFLAPDAALLWVLSGYFLVHLFEHTLVRHFHFGEEVHGHELAHHAGSSALLGLMIHTFFDGVAIASGFLVSTWLGWVITLAIFLHKLPEGFAVSSLMLATGRSRRTSLWAAVALGGVTVLGIVLMVVLRTQVGRALPLSGGVTLYVAASDLIPEVNREPRMSMAALVFLGLALVFLIHHFGNF
ncbi:MAG TPA: ZIP family metal transporter [Candidatus Acidoferrales bacterium]|nr:ZIP family metal transporter [Candidatus Acidoferrales bacterium]